MNMLQDVHTIAERFLRDLENGTAKFYEGPNEAPVIPTADSLTSKVMLMRDAGSPYLVGIKKNGTTVWSRDVRHASSFESDSMTLVNTIATCRKHGIHVETMPACWFHS